MRFRRVRIAAGVTLLCLAGAGTVAGCTYGRGAAFVVKAAGMQGFARTAAEWQSTTVTDTAVPPVPWRGGTLRGHSYWPDRKSGRAILLVPGVHAAGIDEPRLVGFARELAAIGHPVLTVELPDLARYEITTRTTDMIEDAGRWMVRQTEYRGDDGRIGMLGISFGGGLSIVAAARPALRSSVA